MQNFFNAKEIIVWQSNPINNALKQIDINNSINEIIELLKNKLDAINTPDEIEVHFNQDEKFFWGKGYSDEIAKILAKYFSFNGIDESISITVRYELNWRVTECTVKQFLKNGEYHSEYSLNIPKQINDNILEIDANHPILENFNIEDLADEINKQILKSGAKSGKDVEKVIFEFLKETDSIRLRTVNEKIYIDNKFDFEQYFIRLIYAE